MAQLQPLNIVDMTGGLNLRSDAFNLAESESPDMLNVDADPRGGIRSRRRWLNIAAPSTQPTRLHLWDRRVGERLIVAALDDGTIEWANAVRPASVTFPPTMTELKIGSASMSAQAEGHGAEFVEWGDELFIALGRDSPAAVWDGSGGATGLTVNGPTWQNDYTNPSGSYFPKAEHAVAYGGFMVCANTTEELAIHPNRVRFSHPNNPKQWANLDFIDIQGGGSHITGLVAFSDHIVVFKTGSVWAIYGYDAGSFSTVNLSPEAGVSHRNAIALATDSVYFYSHPMGVMEYRPNSGMTEVSEPLRPIIDSGEVNPNALDAISLGWLGRRLWWAAPYLADAATPSDARTVFVYDPQMRSWTAYQGGSRDTPDGPARGLAVFATGKASTKDPILAAYHPDGAVVEVDTDDEGTFDHIGFTSTQPTTRYATRWLHAGWPSLRKSWRRPDYLVSELPVNYKIDVAVRRDYDETTVRSTHIVDVNANNDSAWGAFTWGDGSTYGAAAKGSRIERGGSIGLARSAQLVFSSTDRWQINQLIMKFRARRFR